MGELMKKETKSTVQQVLEDERIIELFWSRDEDAINQTDIKYRYYLCAIAYNIIHDEQDCEECLNDTYLSAWNKIPPTKPRAFQVFLSKIMRNTAVDRYRKNSAAKRVPSEITSALDELDECLPDTSTVESELITKQISEVLNQYLKSLNRRQILTFVCRYYYGDSIKDIALMLKVSENTVLRELARIRQGLKSMLEEEGLYI